MADKKPEPGGRKRGGGGSMIATLFLAIVLVVTALPTVLLVAFGLLPSLVAFIVDRSKGKTATFCVAGLNTCGLLPWLLDLWSGSHTVSTAMGILTNPFALLVIFGAAALGWAFHLLIPQIVASILTVTSQHKVAVLRADQKKMMEEWGAEVAVLPAAPEGKKTVRRRR